MVTVSRRALLPFLALIRVPPVFFVLAPNPIQAGKTPSFLPATVASIERLSPPVSPGDQWSAKREMGVSLTKLIAVNVRISEGGSDHGFAYTCH
jgi:hypothetical protein